MSLALPTSAGVVAIDGASGARGFALLLADVADRDRVALLDQVLEHGQPHASRADDADPFLLAIRHDDQSLLP